MSVVKRIKEYIDFKGVTNQKFEIEIGYSNGAFGSQLKSEVVPVVVAPVVAPEDPNKIPESQANYFKLKTDNIIQHQSVPLYDIQASASVVALFRDKNTETPIDHITIPNLPKCDGAIYVSGDSMYPLLKSGDIILYKKVGNHIDNIFWGEMYLVTLVNDDGDEFVMVKWLHKSDSGQEYIKLVSENRHHQPKDFHIKNIKGLALIKASVRINSMY